MTQMHGILLAELWLAGITVTILHLIIFPQEENNYSESKYSVESVSGKYLENGWSDQYGDFSVEFIIEKLTTLLYEVKWAYDIWLQRYLHESNSAEYLDSL